MTQKNLVKIVLFLVLVATTVFGFMAVPAYMSEVQLRKKEAKQKQANAEELKTLRNLRLIQQDRILRTLAWAKAHNLPDAEQRRLMIIEGKAGDKEFWTTVGSNYKIPLNPKALVER